MHHLRHPSCGQCDSHKIHRLLLDTNPAEMESCALCHEIAQELDPKVFSSWFGQKGGDKNGQLRTEITPPVPGLITAFGVLNYRP